MAKSVSFLSPTAGDNLGRSDDRAYHYGHAGKNSRQAEVFDWSSKGQARMGDSALPRIASTSGGGGQGRKVVVFVDLTIK